MQLFRGCWYIVVISLRIFSSSSLNLVCGALNAERSIPNIHLRISPPIWHMLRCQKRQSRQTSNRAKSRTFATRFTQQIIFHPRRITVPWNGSIGHRISCLRTRYSLAIGGYSHIVIIVLILEQTNQFLVGPRHPGSSVSSGRRTLREHHAFYQGVVVVFKISYREASNWTSEETAIVKVKYYPLSIFEKRTC